MGCRFRAWHLPHGALTVWLYVFCAYIAAVFLLRSPARWRTVSDYSATGPAGLASIGAHFYAGFLLQLILPFQLLPGLRAAAPAVHRWLGRLFAALCMATGLGGTTYTLAIGTVGGLPMDISFAGYGALMVALPVPTVLAAMRGQTARHRRWATRLVAVAIGSALYRLYTAPLHFVQLPMSAALLWLNAAAMVFYLPNLLVAELLIWRVWGYGPEAEGAAEHYLALDSRSHSRSEQGPGGGVPEERGLAEGAPQATC